MAALCRLADIAERSNLPLQLTSFIGRSAEIDAVKGLLMESRLVTLTGAGGIGKTRLALEVARDLLGGYEDGVWLVELAGLTDPQLVPEAVMSALGYITPPGLTPTETLLSVIGPRELLCVLDNCEHLIETAAQLADLLLRRCPGLHMLATSRDVLGVDGEVTWRVPSMTTLDTHRTYGMEELRCCETVQLLIQRARAARPGFDLTDDNAAAVLRICHLVDGIPLAVELVAASTRAMSVTAIEERIAEQFNLITGGRRTSMPRQRTLQATFDWSHQLLSDDEKALFRRLSVFAGGFTLDAAESACRVHDGDTSNQSWLRTLSALVDKSLVISLEGAHEPGRYRLLEPIRQYAAEQLAQADESDEIRSLHAHFFLGLGDDAFRALRGPRQAAWMRRVADELDNFRACFGWALDHDTRAALRLALALERYWIRNNPAEGREWLQKALELYEPRDDLRLQALYDASYWAWYRGFPVEARQLGNDCLALARELDSDLYVGQALSALGAVASTERAEGWITYCLSVYEAAEQHIRRANDLEALGRLLNNYGCTLQVGGDLVRARAKVEEALALANSRDDPWQMSGFLESLAEIEWECGDVAEAEEHSKQVLTIERELGSRTSVAYALSVLAKVAMDTQPERSLRLLGAASSLLSTAGVVEYANDVEDAQRRPRALLGDEASDVLLSEGARMSLQDAVRFGLGEMEAADLEVVATPSHRSAGGEADAPPEAEFVRAGEYWSLTFMGKTVRLRDSKGLRDIAQLMATPGREVAAVDLASGRGKPVAMRELAELGMSAEADAGEMLDSEARAQYRERLTDLEQEIDDADAANDPERAGRAREEREFLLAELSAAVGLSGRPRRALDPAERARKAVTWRIRDALNHVDAAHAELGRHLRRSVRTGGFCVYEPAEPATWRL